MKRSNESQQAGEQDMLEANKRQRFTQSDYGDVYAQYGMMSQYAQANPFAQPAAPAGYAGYAQPMYNMYGGGQSMMASQYGGGCPQQFATASPVYAPTTQPLGGEAIRTIYLGNIYDGMVEPQDVLNNVRTGMVETYRTCPEKSCAFLSFVDPSSAQAFFQEHLAKKLVIRKTEIKIGWGKPNTLSNTLRTQIQGGATRCVYLGQLSEIHTQQFITEAAKKFGPIESVRVVQDKNIAFVHFLSITTAVKCVNELSKEAEWTTVKVNYGKDHCAARNDYNAFGFPGFGQQMGYDAYGAYNPMQNTPQIVANATVLRTLYVGNVHPDAKTEDLCNTIRGGNLLQIRYLPEKKIAFVTFLDATTALAVYNQAQTTGLMLRGRKLRVGWGKPSSIPAPISQAINQGATRNIYIGGIPETLTEEKLRADFSNYGEIELVNTFREKKCAFVNFTSIQNAVSAISAMRTNPEYADFKLNFGKDRCGNPYKPSTRKHHPAVTTPQPEADVKEEPIKEVANPAQSANPVEAGDNQSPSAKQAN